MKYVRVRKENAGKLHKYLISRKLLAQGYPVIKDQNSVAFPINKPVEFGSLIPSAVTENHNIPKRHKPTIQSILKEALTKQELSMLPKGFDTVGSIGILELPPSLIKKGHLIGKAILKLHKNISTVVAKASAHSGDFRLQKYHHLAGKRTLETLHKENRVLLKLDLGKVYFSPRLATERLRIAKQVQPGEHVLVMFSGCGPYVCVIAKNTNADRVVGIELNPVAHAYAVVNKNLNRLTNVELIQGDVRKVLPRERFHRILMPLPKTGETFLQLVPSVALPNAVVHFYDFQDEKDFPSATIAKIQGVFGNRIEVLNAVACGSYSPGVNRVCVDFRLSQAYP